MAKAKLITRDRVTSVSREAVREMIEKIAQTKKLESSQPKSPVGQTVKKKK